MLAENKLCPCEIPDTYLEKQKVRKLLELQQLWLEKRKIANSRVFYNAKKRKKGK